MLLVQKIVVLGQLGLTIGCCCCFCGMTAIKPAQDALNNKRTSFCHTCRAAAALCGVWACGRRVGISWAQTRL